MPREVGWAAVELTRALDGIEREYGLEAAEEVEELIVAALPVLRGLDWNNLPSGMRASKGQRRYRYRIHDDWELTISREIDRVGHKPVKERIGISSVRRVR